MQQSLHAVSTNAVSSEPAGEGEGHCFEMQGDHSPCTTNRANTQVLAGYPPTLRELQRVQNA